jgi:hypothetical protein
MMMELMLVDMLTTWTRLTMFDDVDGIVYNPHPPSQSPNLSKSTINLPPLLTAQCRGIFLDTTTTPTPLALRCRSLSPCLPHQQIDRSAL